MRNVLNFLLRYNYYLVFVVYIAVSLALLFNFNDYQQSWYLSSANNVSSALYSMRSEFTGYIGLRETNRLLNEQNSKLSAEVLRLKQDLLAAKELMPDSTMFQPRQARYSYIVASVLNNSIAHPRNYFTINKGTLAGVKPGMGVMSAAGMTGIVNVAGPNTARVISVLNDSQHFSVKIDSTAYVGTLSWEPGNAKIAYMNEVPKHAKFKKGDLVVSSGFSTTFPEGVPVGRILGRAKGKDSNYLSFKVRLAPDFEKLETVWVITDIYRNELDSLEQLDVK